MFKQYARKPTFAEARPHVPGEDMANISVTAADAEAIKSPGGMVARNPKDHSDQWYIAPAYWADNFEGGAKPLDVTDVADAQGKVRDIKVVGNGDAWQLLGKASSASQGWMKSTKALDLGPEGGCLVQATTQLGSQPAEALAWVPVSIDVLRAVFAEKE